MEKYKLKENGFVDEGSLFSLLDTELCYQENDIGQLEQTEDSKIYLDVLFRFELLGFQKAPNLWSKEFYIVSFGERNICVLKKKQLKDIVRYISEKYNKKCRINKIQQFTKTLTFYTNTVLQ